MPWTPAAWSRRMFSRKMPSSNRSSASNGVAIAAQTPWRFARVRRSVIGGEGARAVIPVLRAEDETRRGRGFGIGALGGEVEGVGDGRLDLGVERFELLRCSQPAGEDALLQACDRVAGFPVLDLLGRPVTGVAHPLRVGTGAVGPALDQRRSLAGAGAGNRRLRRFEDGEDVVAIDGDARHAIAAGALGDVGVAGGVV